MLRDLMMLKNLPELYQGVSYGLIFVFGLMTSFHCLGMCGGIVMTACISEQKGGIKSSIFYNAGRVISYTVIGALVGGLGQIISIQGKEKGIIPIVSGVLMILMGINFLGIAPKLKRYLPHLPTKLTSKIYGQNHYAPFYIGLLTGLMPCGPLQTLQMYALGTASSIKGAISMGIFALGTVPLLFGVGTISTLISNKKSKMITKFSSVIVIIMGLIMLSQGLAIMGIDTSCIAYFFEEDKEISTSQIEEGYQVVNSEIGMHSFPDIIVIKDIPVQWHMQMMKENYNECNKAMNIPVYNIEKTFDKETI